MATYDDIFALMDQDGNKLLSLEEVNYFCETLPNPPTAAIIARLFAQADTDKSGSIDSIEFGALCEGIKMLVGLTESQMVDAYSLSEIKRLFKYLCTADGATMRKDEMRLSLDILNDALELHHSEVALSAAMRDYSKFDFNTFHRIIVSLCPERTLTNIASAFLAEEARRREKIARTKALFEKKKKEADVDLDELENARKQLEVPYSPSDKNGGAANNQSSQGASMLLTATCTKCPALEQQIDRLTAELESGKKRIAEVEEKLANHVMDQVEQANIVGRLQSEVSNHKVRAETVGRSLAEKTKELEVQTIRVTEFEKQLAEMAKERDAARRDAESVPQLMTDLQRAAIDVGQSTTRLARKERELQQAQSEVESVRKKLREAEAEANRLQRFINDAQLKEEESVRMQQLMVEMQNKCSDKDVEMEIWRGKIEEAKAELSARENDLDAQEDALKAKEQQVRKYEMRMHSLWEEEIDKARKELTEASDQLSVRELEIVHKEAELTVREQILQAEITRAESTSLEERTRRLKLLQQVERDLCERERALRACEKSYLEKLITPELQRLREENEQLSRKVFVTRQQAQQQEQQHKQELDRLAVVQKMTKSSALLKNATAAAASSTSPTPASALMFSAKKPVVKLEDAAAAPPPRAVSSLSVAATNSEAGGGGGPLSPSSPKFDL